MNLAETVEQVRKAIIDEAVPDMEILRNVAHLLELNDFEYSQIPNNDDASQRWAEFLLKKAKQQGLLRLCVEQKLLPAKSIYWPNHHAIQQPRLKLARQEGKSVKSVSGGAFEQKRRKH